MEILIVTSDNRDGIVSKYAVYEDMW